MIPSLTKERLSKDYFRSCVDSFYDSVWHNGNRGDAFIRDISDRDLGVDCVLEILIGEKPTGMFALIQLKSTENEIIELKRNAGIISCPNVTHSNLHYCQQNWIPMILVYVHVDGASNAGDKFYFEDIRKEGNRLLNEKAQEKYTLHIKSNSCNDVLALLELVEQNYRNAAN